MFGEVLRQAEWVVVPNESLLPLAPFRAGEKRGLSAGPVDKGLASIASEADQQAAALLAIFACKVLLFHAQADTTIYRDLTHLPLCETSLLDKGRHATAERRLC